jgi:hypothetical protein
MLPNIYPYVLEHMRRFGLFGPSPDAQANWGASNMSHAKQSSKSRTRNKVVPVLGAAGLSLSLVSGTSAATRGLTAAVPTRNITASHEITLREEEVFDVNLATFYLVNKETAGTFRPRRLLAMGGGGGCCGGCAGCAAATANYGASTLGTDANPHQPLFKPKRTHAPKNP